MNKRWVTLFPQGENFHLLKDVGYIPYIMHKNYGFDSYFVSYDNDKFEYQNTYLKGLKIDLLSRVTGNLVIDSLIYIFKNAKNIDVLNFYHFRKAFLIWALVYKVLNKNGKIYLKLDANESIKKIKFNKITDYMFIKILQKIDLISVETIELHKWLNDNWPRKIEYIPSGFWADKHKNFIEYNKKENIILTVGRIGAEEKANHLLLDAFTKIYDKIPGWKLNFVGQLTDEFKKYAEELIYDNAELKDKVNFTGYIGNVDKLNDQYAKAKIFCMTSLYESFGLVFVEALKNGCYIITSNVLAAKDITCNEKYGSIFNVNDEVMLEKYLLEWCHNEALLKEVCIPIQQFAYENFSWDVIGEKIYIGLNKI